MRHEHAARALVELRQIGKTPSGADPVLQHAPKTFNGIEVVATMRRQEMQPKLLVPVCQRRRELFRPVDATAVGDHDHLFAGVAKEGHHLMLTSCKNFEICRIGSVAAIIYGFKLCFSAFLLSGGQASEYPHLASCSSRAQLCSQF